MKLYANIIKCQDKTNHFLEKGSVPTSTPFKRENLNRPAAPEKTREVVKPSECHFHGELSQVLIRSINSNATSLQSIRKDGKLPDSS